MPEELPQLPKTVLSRKYLKADEIDLLLTAAKKTRNPIRDQLIVWSSYRHGLRSVELVGLRWEAVDFELARLHVWRAKNGRPSVHPIQGKELRLLRTLQRRNPKASHIFMSERGGVLSRRAVRKIVKLLGEKCLKFPINHHMFRHSCGYALANDGQDTRAIQDYLGHKNINHTVIYTALSADRFNNFWQNGSNRS